MRKRSPKISTRRLTREVNRLTREIEALTQGKVERAIRAGEILLQLKDRVGHGHWRVWVEKNLAISIRTASRWINFFLHRDKIKDAKTIREAEALLTSTERGRDAIGADYWHIERSLVTPLRLVRRRLAKLSYVGDSPEIIERIKDKLRAEVEELSADLSP
jgi:hypothetical protein